MIQSVRPQIKSPQINQIRNLINLGNLWLLLDSVLMNKSIEVEAKTTKQAIKIALKQLGISKSEAKIEILREEHKGLFGMEGAEPAKVRVTVKTVPKNL